MTFTLSRTLITISSRSLLLTDWGISCITTLFRLLYWSALFILILLFIRASSNRQTWPSSFPTRFCNDETSFFKLWMISSFLPSNFTVIPWLSLLIVSVILFLIVIYNSISLPDPEKGSYEIDLHSQANHPWPLHL